MNALFGIGIYGVLLGMVSVLVVFHERREITRKRKTKND